MGKKKPRCYVCGKVEGLVQHSNYYDLHLCQQCESAVDWWEGLPVLAEKPSKCPFCGNKDLIPNGIGDYDAKYDEALAIDLGISDEDGEYTICHYIYDCVACESDECTEDSSSFWCNIPYGPPKYFSGDDIMGGYVFENDRPMTTKERQARELKQQLDAGQLTLFKDWLGGGVE